MRAEPVRRSARTALKNAVRRARTLIGKLLVNVFDEAGASHALTVK